MNFVFIIYLTLSVSADSVYIYCLSSFFGSMVDRGLRGIASADAYVAGKPYSKNFQVCLFNNSLSYFLFFFNAGCSGFHACNRTYFSSCTENS
jgi:hypothetical protein